MGVLPRRRVLMRLVLIACLIPVLYVLYHGIPTCLHSILGESSLRKPKGAAASGREMFERLDMTTRECRAVFPGLTKEIEGAVERGPFELKRQPGHAVGIVQGRIEDGKVGASSLGVEGCRIGMYTYIYTMLTIAVYIALCDFGG